LVAFESARAELLAAELPVIAASTDDADHAAATVRELGLGFPVGHGLPLEATAERFGAYYETRRGIVHATGFVVRPDRSLAIALYSSGAIGRLVPDEIIRVVEVLRQRA
jgi:alkyl hydroperoxide reductase subunit AhpC